jgi:transcriptional regulator with XRE-family HTH domain
MSEMIRYRRANVPIVKNGVHPLVRWIWREINNQKCSQHDVSARSGVSASAMRKWRLNNRNPRIIELEAVINALGARLVVRVEDSDA